MTKDTESVELGQRVASAGVNAGHGVQGLGFLEREIEATRHEARTCVCM